MIGTVFDLECDGLNPTKIHCISSSVTGHNGGPSITNYDEMREFFEYEKVLVGHNIQRFDIPHAERLLGIKIKAQLIDTLALSWYLTPERLRHGLEEYGEEFGVPKPKIDDWENLTVEDYCHRCEEDVKINKRLWEKQWRMLMNIYENEEAVLRFLKYIEFKMDCAREQEKHGWKLDEVKCQELLVTLNQERQKRVEELTEVMPKVPIKAKRAKPAKPYRINGELSEHGKTWFKLLEESNLQADYEGVVEYVKGWNEPNPSSHTQIKDWLYSLGWVPETFAFKRDKATGEVTKIPQVQQDKALGPGLCASVKKLYDREPKLSAFEGLAIVTHRIGIVEGFLNNVQDGYVQAQVQGLTNTLRFKHKVVVNLPGVDKPYGADIRSCLHAPEGSELAGSDMSSLEDRTKQHYMWPHDPEYVREMMTPDFDPHIDLSVNADLMAAEDAKSFKEADDAFKHTKLYTKLKETRAVGKKVNYTCVYGAGSATIARAAGCSKAEAEKLREAYWERNWAVVKIAEQCEVKVCNGSMWLYNPVSRFWYSLRFEKDRFSTLNQSTGVYAFDTYVKHIRNGGPPIVAQFHDEVVMLVRVGNRERLKQHVDKAIGLTNEELKLNRQLDVGLDFGNNYSEIH